MNALDIDITALTSAHARLAFTRNMQPLIDTFLAQAATEGMSLSGVRGQALSGNRAQVWFEYDDAGRRVFVEVRTYQRRGGLGVYLRGDVLDHWRRTGHIRFINSRGLAATQISVALAGLRSACSNELESRDRRLEIQSMLRGAGFEEGVSFCGTDYQRDGLAVEEHCNGWHVTIPSHQALSIIAGMINHSG